MNDLRREINEIFASQQTQMGDVSQTSNRMMRAATGTRRVSPQVWRSVAGVAMVLVAATAVGTAVAIRGLHPKGVVTHHPSPTPIATPAPTPVPTAIAQPLNVPASVPVILFHDPVNFDQIDGITWDGSAKGRLGVNPETGNGILPNPAGTLWATTHEVRDRTGAVVATLARTTKGFPGTWADDGRHYCSMASKDALGQVGGVPATLQVAAVGQPPRNVVQIGRVYEQTGAGIAACSIDKDRAVAVQSSSTGTAVQFWVVQLSTGRVLWSRPSGDIRASRDGQYIAEIGYDQATGTSSTTIYSPTGVVLGHVAGRVDAFSWDGTLAVQMESFGAQVSVINWRSGAVVWKGPSSNGGYLEAVPEPGGERIAVSVSDPLHPQTGGFPPRIVYVVGPDGQAVKLLDDVM